MIICQILEKTLQEFYKNPTFVTFCDDAINDNIIYTKHVFIIKEQLCQSFWQSVKHSDLRKKIEGGPFDPHSSLRLLKSLCLYIKNYCSQLVFCSMNHYLERPKQ